MTLAHLSPLRFTVGRWSADPSADELSTDGRVVKLEPRTMRLLLVLTQSPGQVVTTERLLDAVWPGLFVTHGSLYEAVAQLRKVLGPGHIATVPRKGYRLVATVGQVEGEKPAAPSSPTPRLGPRSIAVLPFRVRQLPESHAFIRESLTGDLIDELSRQRALVVVARGTMLSYVGQDLLPQDVSRELGVRYVVTGSIEWRGDMLHIDVHVVDVGEGTQNWADAVDVLLAEWPQTGHVVVGRLARALEFELLDLAAREPTPTDGDSLRARALATRAWVELFARAETKEVNERASAWAQEALALEPQLPLASICLAFCHWRAAQFGWLDRPMAETLASAMAYAERAVELGPRDPDAHYVLGLVAYSSRESARAEEALHHCLRLSSSHAPAYGLLALVRTRRGHPEEAAALCERAFTLSPREPLRVVWHLAQAWAALAMDDPAAALEASQRAMAVNADFATCYVTGAAAAQQLGDSTRAKTWVAFLRERSVFSSVQALRMRLPAVGEVHQRQLDQVIGLLREAGLPLQ